MEWKCKDGRIVDIDKMEDSHLQNTIKYIERVYSVKTELNILKWTPTKKIKQSYEYMKKVLAKRILDEFKKEEEKIKSYQDTFINPLENL